MIIDLTPPPGDWPALPALPREDIASGAADQTGLTVFEAPGLTVGFWGCSPWVATPGPYPSDEFMILLEGSVTILLPDGRAETIRAGQSFFIPKGLDCTWDQPEPVKKIYVIFEGGAAKAGVGLPLTVDPAMPLAPSPAPAPAILDSKVPVQRAAQVYADGSGQISVGVWATSAYRRKPIPFPRHELMHILSGEVTMTSDGVTRTWAAGQSFFVPMGAVVDWVGPGELAKVYCSIMPKDAP